MKHKIYLHVWMIALLLLSFRTFAISTYLTKAEPDQPVTNSTYITFEFKSDVANARFRCSLGTQDFSDCTSPHKLSHLQDGKYHFRVYAYSSTDGIDPIGATHDWRVDTVPPSTVLQVQTIARDRYLATFDSSEPNSTFECSIDGASSFPCRSPFEISGLPNGNHVFDVRALDEATNRDPSGKQFQFTVMVLNITTSITDILPRANYTNDRSVQIQFISNIVSASFDCRFLGRSFPCGPPFSQFNLADGVYIFHVNAKDTFGNVDNVGASYTWTVDTRPPVASLRQLDSTSTIITVSWTTDEPATTELSWGIEPALNRKIPPDLTLTTQHQVRLVGLSSQTLYSVQPGGVDRAMNSYLLPRSTIRTKR